MAAIADKVDHELLTVLVDRHREELDAEYKAWMDLSLPELCAKIAKHICALANSGGGWIIFGINDDGSHCEPHPGDLSAYSQDNINGARDVAAAQMLLSFARLYVGEERRIPDLRVANAIRNDYISRLEDALQAYQKS